MTQNPSLEAAYHRHLHCLYEAPIGTSVLTSAANALMQMGSDPAIIRNQPEIAYRAVANVAYLSSPWTPPFNRAVNTLRELGNNPTLAPEWAARARNDATDYTARAEAFRSETMVSSPQPVSGRRQGLQLVVNKKALD